MKYLYILIALFFSVAINANAQIYNEDNYQADDSLQSPPMIDVKPCEFRVSSDETGFITRQVKVLNRGGSPLRITKVTGSCGCSKASIQSGLIHPLGVGKIILFINTDGLYDENRTVEYVIESNAKNSPTSVRVIFEEPDENEDDCEK
jgi:hypothetical protein